jgi:heavy metal translocating P-type ATPase
LGIGTAIAGQAMMLGLALNLSPAEGAAHWLLHGTLLLSTAAVVGLLGGPLLQTAWENVRRRALSVEFLFLSGIMGALGISLSATFVGRGAVYYEVVAVLLTVYALGRTLGAQSKARAVAESRQLRTAFDQCRRLGSDGTSKVCHVTEIEPGDRVAVLAGEAVPIDGRIMVGEAFVRETPLSGEPFPVVRRVGDVVLAGSFCEDAPLQIEAATSGRNRRLDAILAHTDSLQDSVSSLQAEADRLVRWFLPIVLVVTLTTLVVWGVKADWTAGLLNALAVLLVACPCAMGLATPVGIWRALAILASRGLVARSAELIPRLADVRHVVFDKTGTLSEESFSLVDLAVDGDVSLREQLKAVLSRVQALSAHPVARAFAGLSSQAEAQITVRALKPIPGRGVEAWVEVDGRSEWHLRLGQPSVLQHPEAAASLLTQLRHRPGDHLVYLEVDGRLRGIAAVRERYRASADEALGDLAALGLPRSVLTGDRPERAQVAGVDTIRASLTPEAKADHVRQLQKAGEPTLFVGDGVNDAPAMSCASASIALAQGAGLASSTADAVLFGGDLRIIPWAIQVSRQTRSVIRSNLWFAAAYNALGIGLAALGWLHPVAAALIMVISSLVVSWRALQASDLGGPCCMPSREDEAESSTGWLGLRWVSWHGVALALQGPLIVMMLGIRGWEVTGWLISFGMAGWVMARWRPHDLEARRYWRMTQAMLGPCNLGMLLGWWIDLGLVPVVLTAGHSCCHVSVHPLLHAVQMPGMYLGMLALGLPPMLRDLGGANRWGTFVYALLAALGMVIGMSYGTALVENYWRPPGIPGFLALFAGMTVGMLAGMFFCCELGRVVWARWFARS